MKKFFDTHRPIFEIGPKLYIYGKEALKMAIFADSLSEQYDVQIIFSAQYVDIPAISHSTKNIYVFSQHIDPVYPGRGMGAILPEAIRESGAVGTILNHAEKKLSLHELYCTIQRCKQVGLISLVCADSIPECIASLHLGADMILKESESMIDSGKSCPDREIQNVAAALCKHKKELIILHGAGIKDEYDIYDIIFSGAVATGCTSAIFKSKDPYASMERCIAATRQAWDDKQKRKAVTNN